MFSSSTNGYFEDTRKSDKKRGAQATQPKKLMTEGAFNIASVSTLIFTLVGGVSPFGGDEL